MTVHMARKLADLLNRADWHAGRMDRKRATEYYEDCFGIMDGIRPPDHDCAVRRLYEQLVVAARADVPSSFAGRLRALGVEALEEIERTLYIPRGRIGDLVVPQDPTPDATERRTRIEASPVPRPEPVKKEVARPRYAQASLLPDSDGK